MSEASVMMGLKKLPHISFHSI